MRREIMFLILILVAAAILVSWEFRNRPKTILETGTVKYIDLEGGFYGIVADSGKRYLPINLEDKFKVGGLRVEFKAKIRRDIKTIQMWGTPIEIVEIRKKKEEGIGDLSQVRVAVQYRIVTDGKKFNRTLDDVVNIFKETNTDFIFQGWLTQWPLPDRCSDLAINERERCNLEGYSYEHLKNAVYKIKKELPNVIFGGGTQFEYLYPDELQGRSEKERRDKAWNMTLNPEKWGIKFSRNDMQCYWAKRWGFINKQKQCPSEEELKQKMPYYFPDITNPEFQNLFLKRIYRQIDAGVDAVWIDMLYAQPVFLRGLTKDENHPAVKESYKAAWDIVDKIHKYGLKKGKKIYVITWVAHWNGTLIVSKTNIDMAMVSPSADEVKNKDTGEIAKFDKDKWDIMTEQIREKFGIPVFARIDYGGVGRTPLSAFSQELTKDEAKIFLKKADEFFSSRNIVFIYPVHGGNMGAPGKVEKLSYGKFNWYDALAPEFDTYKTIKELAKNKSDSRDSAKSKNQTEVAILYDKITDGIYHPSKIRTYKDLVNILKETQPDIVFNMWLRWVPTPDSLSPSSPEYQAGATYQQLEETLGMLKKKFPRILFFGAIPAQRINFEERNPITGKKYSKEEVWQMALNPRKWGINVSKEKLQELAQKSGTGKYGYFPDITNKNFQELYLSWAKKQIDSGVEGLRLDMLFAQPRYLAEITKDKNHKSVKESLRAIDYLIGEIKTYGKSKSKEVYLGSWYNFIDFPNYSPDLDFITISPTKEEIVGLKLDDRRWDDIISSVRKRLPNAKIVAFIDWAGTTNTPLGVFSQKLSREEQNEFLRTADAFFKERGIIFAYPVHGGFMGQDATTLSFGRVKVYDSLAPEFQTYDTIKELAQNKKEHSQL